MFTRVRASAPTARYVLASIASVVAGATAVSVLTAPQAYALQSPLGISSKPPPKINGLLIWGQGAGPIPHRVEYFNNKKLRHVALSPQVCAAVLQNGDVVTWVPKNVGGPVNTTGQGAQLPLAGDDVRVLLKGKGINKVAVSHGLVYAASSSKVFVCDPAPDNNKIHSEVVPLENASLGWFESIDDFKCGKDHMILLTSKGRVFTGATGIFRPETSKGQFGIASMSQFEQAPLPNKLHEIRLLANIPIAKIAAGDYHSLLLTKNDSKLLGFGDNTYSQLAMTYRYGTANVAVPTKLRVNEDLSVKDIAAGGSVSYFLACSSQPDDLLSASASPPPPGSALPGKTSLYAIGNGISGQLGTGSFANQQKDPVRVKFFDQMEEYDESTNSVRPINIKHLTVGSTHTGAVVDNAAPSSVFIWGGNDFSQIGNAKKSRSPKPIPLPALSPDAPIMSQMLEPNETLVCGENLSAVYTTN